MEKARIFDNQLITNDGNILDENVLSSNASENHDYAAVVMCGHVGFGYFIPILFDVRARNKEIAKRIIKNAPRVKNNITNCILEMKEISRYESLLIWSINHHDKYLVYDAKKRRVNSRKVIMPEYARMLEDISKGVKLSNTDKVRMKYFDLKDISEIKCANQYYDYQVLQRYFAPEIVGEKICYPKKVNMDVLLKEYFDEFTKHIGIEKEDPFVLLYYYKVFGPENELGISPLDNKMCFVNQFGEKKSVELPENLKIVLDEESDYRLLKALESNSKTQSLDTDSADGKSKTGLERFNDRMKKTMQTK